MHDHIARAADVAGARQGHRLGEGHRNGRVHRVAALAQDVDADAGRRIALADHHAAASHDRAVDLAVVDDIAAAARGRPDLDRRLLGQHRPSQQHQGRSRNSRRRLHQTQTHTEIPASARASRRADRARHAVSQDNIIKNHSDSIAENCSSRTSLSDYPAHYLGYRQYFSG